MIGRRRQREDGQALVEIGLCLPILCILLMAVVEYGLVIWQGMELTSATRDGARRAVVARVEPSPTSAVRDTVRSSFDTVDPTDVTVTVTGGWERDDVVTVRSSLPASIDILGFEAWSGTLDATSRVRIG